jgi:hypothetical protein
MDIVNALYKKFVGFAKQDYPSTPRIESGSNANRINWDDTNALGEERKLSNQPLNDFWQIAIEYKKSRDFGAINIKSGDDQGFASAIYNQYGKTHDGPRNTDTMIYKHPEKGDEIDEDTDDKTAASDKGVSYKLAITKFAEIRQATKWKDKRIAAEILEFYKTGEMPELITQKNMRQNFGYLTTLMTVPESVRSIGTFPFGLIMLDNISKGEVSAADAFIAPEDKLEEIKGRKKLREENGRIKAAIKREEEKSNPKKDTESGRGRGRGGRGGGRGGRVPKSVDTSKDEELAKKPLNDVVQQYKDGPDAGGLYAPAFSGSKKPLNTIEAVAENEDLTVDGPYGENQDGYYWKTTVERYNEMVKVFLGSHPEMLSFNAEDDDRGTAIDSLISRIITHFGIGAEITAPSTVKREIGRETNNALWNISSGIKAAKFGSATMMPFATTTSVSDFKFAANMKTPDAMNFGQTHLRTQQENNEALAESVSEYPIPPHSPTHELPKFNSRLNNVVTKDRKGRYDAPEEVLTGMPGVIENLGRHLEQDDKTRAVIRSFSLSQKGGDNEGKKRKAEDFDETPAKKLKPEGLQPEQLLQQQLMIRRMQLVSQMQQMIFGVAIFALSNNYTRTDVEKNLAGNTDFLELVNSQAHIDPPIVFQDSEILTLIGSQLDMLGFAHETNEVSMREEK